MAKITRRYALFLISILLLVIIFCVPLKELIELSSVNELYSHIPLMPLLSGYFFYFRRKSIFSEVEYSPGAGGTLTAAGCALYAVNYFTRVFDFNQNDRLSLVVLSGMVVLAGIFTLFYGVVSLRRAAFPLLLLLFAIPLPSQVAQEIIHLLQRGSAETVSLLFGFLGVPVLRDGYVFNLPNLSVEIAEECSGIRSSIALAITAIIAGNLFLQRGWTRIVLVASVIPLAILKNGIRIVTLSVLGVYFDERILQSDLHHKGGVVFFVLSLLLLSGLIFFLRRVDKG
jgi:exosortase